MKSIWVIEQGSYSDYRVVGVFSSKENAEAVLGVIERSPYDEPTIAEWPLDPAVSDIAAGRSTWLLHMARNGEVRRIEGTTPASYDLAGKIWLWERTKAPAYRGRKDIDDVLVATVWAKDSAHAVKIVNERRAQMIANNEWPEQAAMAAGVK